MTELLEVRRGILTPFRTAFIIGAILLLSLGMQFVHLTCREYIKSPSLCNTFQTINELMPWVIWVAFIFLFFVLFINAIKQYNEKLTPRARRMSRRQRRSRRFE